MLPMFLFTHMAAHLNLEQNPFHFLVVRKMEFYWRRSVFLVCKQTNFVNKLLR